MYEQLIKLLEAIGEYEGLYLIAGTSKFGNVDRGTWFLYHVQGATTTFQPVSPLLAVDKEQFFYHLSTAQTIGIMVLNSKKAICIDDIEGYEIEYYPMGTGRYVGIACQRIYIYKNRN